MKVFLVPDSIPAPSISGDWSIAMLDELRVAEDEHQIALAEWLRANGYNGPHTGGIVAIPHADSFARYMMADAKKGSCLIHLPYGDGWHSPHAKNMPKRDAVRYIEQEKRLQDMFAARKESV